MLSVNCDNNDSDRVVTPDGSSSLTNRIESNRQNYRSISTRIRIYTIWVDLASRLRHACSPPEPITAPEHLHRCHHSYVIYNCSSRSWIRFDVRRSPIPDHIDYESGLAWNRQSVIFYVLRVLDPRGTFCMHACLRDHKRTYLWSKVFAIQDGCRDHEFSRELRKDTVWKNLLAFLGSILMSLYLSAYVLVVCYDTTSSNLCI